VPIFPDCQQSQTDSCRHVRHVRRWLLYVAFPLAVAALSGCETCGYYKQAIQGQYSILTRRQPLDELIAAPQTPVALKEKFQLVLRLHEFAEQELKLPANGHYLRYVDLNRRYVVWNVHAAPEFSLKPKTWWYPVVGSLKYRGYFSETDALRYGARMEKSGWDVYVEGVEAYSTLGWFRDPVLSTFIHHEEAELAEILFHELAHQRLFVAGDTDFNEAFATAVGEEGVRRWLRVRGADANCQKYLAGLERQDQFVRLMMSARRQLESLYGAQKSGLVTATPEETTEQRRRKALVIEETRIAYTRLKAEWGGYTGYDYWFAQSLNNAQLNTVATYYHLAPAFQRLLQVNDGNLEKFYGAVRELSKLPKKERLRRLGLFLAK